MIILTNFMDLRLAYYLFMELLYMFLRYSFNIILDLIKLDS
jgi:hypothetical protein